MYEGNGAFYYENDYYYVGHFVKGVKQGKDIIYYNNGKTKYDGDFVNNKYEGNGTLYHDDGEYYIGQFLKGERHGKGILYYKNGNIKYEGDFVHNKKEAMGNIFGKMEIIIMDNG